jgi:hypothetical protein
VLPDHDPAGHRSHDPDPNRDRHRDLPVAHRHHRGADPRLPDAASSNDRAPTTKTDPCVRSYPVDSDLPDAHRGRHPDDVPEAAECDCLPFHRAAAESDDPR